jgi:hypothetical protein
MVITEKFNEELEEQSVLVKKQKRYFLKEGYL